MFIGQKVRVHNVDTELWYRNIGNHGAETRDYRVKTQGIIEENSTVHVTETQGITEQKHEKS